MIRYAIACAMLAAPGTALAQASAGQTPVTVEIIASGEVSVPAQRFRMSITITAKGDTEDAAKAALVAHRAKIVQLLAAQGVREAQSDKSPGSGSSFMSMFASLGGLSKPTVSLDMLGDDPDAKPQATAKETVQFDAPTRAAAASARKLAESNDATAADEVIGLLDDYQGASRRAKADAIAKARTEAAVYGETLGLRQATIVSISEKQDVVGGALGFVSQIVGMFAPKTGAETNDVTVRETLTIQFKLGK